jgi:hypothetical protein
MNGWGIQGGNSPLQGGRGDYFKGLVGRLPPDSHRDRHLQGGIPVPQNCGRGILTKLSSRIAIQLVTSPHALVD